MQFIRPFAQLFENWIDPLQKVAMNRPPKTVSGFMWYYISQAKAPFLAFIIISGLTGGLEAVMYYFLGRIIDILDASNAAEGWAGIFGNYGQELLVLLVFMLFVRWLVTFLAGLIDNQVIDRTFFNLVSWQTTTHVMRQSVGFFASRHSGSVLTKVGQVSSSIINLITGAVGALWTILVFTTTTMVLLAQLDIMLMVIVMVWIALVLLLARYFLPRMRKQAAKVAEAGAALNGRAVDIYSNIQTVKLFGTDADADGYLREAYERQLGVSLTLGRFSIGLQTSLVIVSSIAFVSVAAMCVDLWTRGAITVGEIAFALGLVFRLANWLGRLLGSFNHLMRNFGILQNAMETVTYPVEIADKPDSIDWAPEKGAITFEDVDFAYLPRKEVVENFSLEIKPGEKIGLVGQSGAGKTTIVNLLLRFYDRDSGSIRIDGQDIADVKQESLRAAIGVVTQDTALLHRSVRDNILYGRPGATDEEVIAAAKRAEAHDFILDLKDSEGRTGYDAEVGERGVKLSGGQRQRIAIARVILKNAPILVLDEATSALDSEIEAAIQEQLAGLMRGKTVVAIAHRLSTIAAMDRLVVLDGGKIVEKGTHAELLRKNGHYARLWARQSGGFIGDIEEESDAAAT